MSRYLGSVGATPADVGFRALRPTVLPLEFLRSKGSSTIRLSAPSMALTAPYSGSRGVA